MSDVTLESLNAAFKRAYGGGRKDPVNFTPMTDAKALGAALRRHSRVELGLLELWLAREHAWSLAMREGLPR